MILLSLIVIPDWVIKVLLLGLAAGILSGAVGWIGTLVIKWWVKKYQGP